MKSIRFLAALLVLLTFSLWGTSGLLAQNYPIQAMLTITPPYSNLFGDYLNVNKVQLTLTGTANIRVAGYLRSNTGVNLNLPENYEWFLNHGGLPIAVNNKRILTTNDLKMAFSDRLVIDNSTKNLELDAIGNYILPEGDYEFCIKVFDGSSNRQLSEKVCAYFTIQNIEPPFLLAPADKDPMPMASATYQPVQFQWTFPAGANPTRIEYVVQIAELLPGQNPYNVFESGPSFAEIVVPNASPIYILKPSDPRLEIGRQYAWRVRVRGKGQYAGLTNFQNNGLSTVNTFVYGGTKTLADNLTTSSEKVVSTKKAAADTSGTVNTLAGGNCACKFPPISNKTLKPTLDNSQPVFIGGKSGYQLSISKIDATGDKYTGTGTVTLSPDFKPTGRNGAFIPLKVDFKDIQVNTDGVMVSGQVQSTKSKDNLIGFLPTTAASPNLPDLGELTKIATNGNWKKIQDKILQDASQQVSQQLNGTGLETPIGYSSGAFTLAIDNIIFTPNSAQYDAMTVIDVADGTDKISIPLGVKGACLPIDNCEGSNVLYLLKDTEIPYLSITLKGGTDASKTTYYTYSPNKDKGATNELSIVAEYKIPGAAPIMGSGPVMATLRTKTKDGFDNWHAEATVAEEFKMAGIDDFSFKLTKATYDHDLNWNPDGFRDMLAGLTKDGVGNDKLANLQKDVWQGFFMDELRVTLPGVFQTEDGKTSMPVKNLLIGANLGLSGSLGAEKVIDYKKGSLGGWFFSLDQIGITFFDGVFVKANADGKIGLPITGKDEASALVYTNTLSTDSTTKKLSYLFKVVPDKDINVPIWKANMKLASTSSISVVVTGSTVDATADLNGSISFKADLGGPIPDFNMDLMDVQHLKIMSKAPYISVDKLESPIYTKGGELYQKASAFVGSFASPQHTLGSSPMPITLDAFTPVVTSSGGNTKAGFYFHGSLDLADLPLSPKAGVGLVVLANVKMDGIRPVFSYDRTELEDVQVGGQLGPVKVDGSLKFFREDKTFGNGFKGNLDATFGTAKIEGQSVFGRKDFAYWYFYLAGISESGLFQVGPVTVNGIGGGLYHNMTPPQPDPNKFAELKATTEHYAYTPSLGTDGLKAAFYFSVASKYVLNAKATIEGSMTDGAVNTISVEGLGKLIGDENKSMLQADVKAMYDFRQQVFSLDAGITGGIDKVLTVNGQLALRADFKQEKYTLKIGEPSNRTKLKVLKGVVDATGYFMVGNSDIPPIPPPSEDIISASSMEGFKRAGYKPISMVSSVMPTSFGDTTLKNSPGLAFGATLKVEVGVDFAIFWAKFKAGAGFDVNIQKLEAQCEGYSGLIGENGWYAQGQAYAEFQGAVGVSAPFIGDVTLIDLKAAALLQTGMPTPSWFKGFVHGEAHVAGIYDGSFDLPVSIGEPCTVITNPFSDKPLFAEFNINAANKKKVDILLNPQVRLNYPNKFRVDGITSKGEAFGYNYEIRVETTLSPGMTGEQYYNDDKVLYRKERAFKPNSTYSVTFRAKAFQNGHEYLFNNKAVKQDTTIASFRTGPCIALLDNSILAYAFPYQEQAYYLQGESNRSTVRLKMAVDCLFDPEKVKTEIVVTPFKDAPKTASIKGTTIQKTSTGKQSIDLALPTESGMNNLFGGKTASVGSTTALIGFSVDRKQNVTALALLTKPQGTPIHIPVEVSPKGSLLYTMPQLPNNTDIRVEVVQRPVVPPALLAFKQRSVQQNIGNLYVSDQKTTMTDTDQNKTLASLNAVNTQTFTASIIRDTTSKKLAIAQPDSKVILGYEFHTSRYNTLTEKLTANGTTPTAESAFLSGDHTVIASFPTIEGFDQFDADAYPFDDNGKPAENEALVNVSEENNRWYNETIKPLNRHWMNLQDQLRKTPKYQDYNTLELFDNDNIHIQSGEELVLVSTRVREIADNRLAVAKGKANWVKANAANYHKWVDDTYKNNHSTYNTTRGFNEGGANKDHMFWRLMIAAGDKIDPIKDYNPYPFGDFNYLKANIIPLSGSMGSDRFGPNFPFRQRWFLAIPTQWVRAKPATSAKPTPCVNSTTETVQTNINHEIDPPALAAVTYWHTCAGPAGQTR